MGYSQRPGRRCQDFRYWTKNLVLMKRDGRVVKRTSPKVVIWLDISEYNWRVLWICLLPQQLQTQSGSRKDKSNLSLKAFLTSLWLCLPSSSSAVYSPLPSLIYWRTLFNRFHGTSFHSRHLLLTNPPFSGCFRKNGSLDELGQVLWSLESFINRIGN